MRRSAVAALGLLTAWPLLYMALFFVLVFTLVLSERDSEDPSWFPWLFVAHGLTMVISLGLVTFYAVQIARRDDLGDQKIVWLLVVLLGGPIAMPVYWYLHMWRRPARS